MAMNSTPLQAGIHHAVDRVRARAANADDLNRSKIAVFVHFVCIHFEIQAQGIPLVCINCSAPVYFFLFQKAGELAAKAVVIRIVGCSIESKVMSISPSAEEYTGLFIFAVFGADAFTGMPTFSER